MVVLTSFILLVGIRVAAARCSTAVSEPRSPAAPGRPSTSLSTTKTIITLSTAATGTAKSAPGMPASSEPVATATTTPSGCTFTAVAHDERLQHVALDLLHEEHDRRA